MVLARNRQVYLRGLSNNALAQLLANRLQMFTKTSPQPFQVVMSQNTLKDYHASRTNLINMIDGQKDWPNVWRGHTNHEAPSATLDEKALLPLKTLMIAHGGSRFRTYFFDPSHKKYRYAASPLLRDWALQNNQPVVATIAALLAPGTRGAVVVCRDQAVAYPVLPGTWKMIDRPLKGRPSVHEGEWIDPDASLILPKGTQRLQKQVTTPDGRVTAIEIIPPDQTETFFKRQHQTYNPSDRTISDANPGSHYRYPNVASPQPVTTPHLRHFYGRYLPNFLPKAPSVREYQS